MWVCRKLIHIVVGHGDGVTSENNEPHCIESREMKSLVLTAKKSKMQKDFQVKIE